MYRQDRGHVIVTSSELKIHGEHWDIANIDSLVIIDELLRPGEGQRPTYVYDPAIQQRAWPSALLFVLGLLIFFLFRDSILFVLAFLPFLAGVLYLVYLINKHPQKVYSIRLGLKRGENLYSEYIPAYRWKDRPAVERVIASVERAKQAAAS